MVISSAKLFDNTKEIGHQKIFFSLKQGTFERSNVLSKININVIHHK